MKIEMHEDGTLVIWPETELEAYALNKWCDENLPEDGLLGTGKMLIMGEINKITLPKCPDVDIAQYKECSCGPCKIQKMD